LNPLFKTDRSQIHIQKEVISMQRIMIAMLAVLFFVGFNAAAFADDKAKTETKTEMKGDAKKDTKGAEKKEEKKDKKTK